jgi:hypothetical protein
MANFSISPGVTISEVDNTFLTNTVVGASTAIVGPTVKGPVNIPTLVTSYTDYQSLFGDSLISGSDTYSYFTSISAYNFFNYGGNSLLVTRVASGSYTPATSSYVANFSASSYVIDGYVDPSYVTVSSPLQPFVLETLSEGEMMNSSGSLYSNGTLENGTADNFIWQIVSPNINN